LAGPGGDTASARAAEFADAHRALLADGSIQFELARAQVPVVPAWARSFGHFLISIFPVLRVLFWCAVAAGVIFLLYLIARRLSGAAWPWPRKTQNEAVEDWRPAEAPARALLRDADALAQAGRYDEAVRLLLFRSIEDIESRRPKLVRPALTSRDIAGAQGIPEGARRAFTSIVSAVERSLFGGRALAEPDWGACRAAYERFAFAESWR
jgi:hypothetical protein